MSHQSDLETTNDSVSAEYQILFHCSGDGQPLKCGPTNLIRITSIPAEIDFFCNKFSWTYSPGSQRLTASRVLATPTDAKGRKFCAAVVYLDCYRFLLTCRYHLKDNTASEVTILATNESASLTQLWLSIRWDLSGKKLHHPVKDSNGNKLLFVRLEDCGRVVRGVGKLLPVNVRFQDTEQKRLGISAHDMRLYSN